MNKQIESLRRYHAAAPMTQAFDDRLPGIESMLDALLAAYDASGWRDRAPTAAEVEAHDGRWIYDRKSWVWPYPDVYEKTALIAAISGFWLSDDEKNVRWRPVTNDWRDAPWPEVKP